MTDAIRRLGRLLTVSLAAGRRERMRALVGLVALWQTTVACHTPEPPAPAPPESVVVAAAPSPSVSSMPLSAASVAASVAAPVSDEPVRDLKGDAEKLREQYLPMLRKVLASAPSECKPGTFGRTPFSKRGEKLLAGDPSIVEAMIECVGRTQRVALRGLHRASPGQETASWFDSQHYGILRPSKFDLGDEVSDLHISNDSYAVTLAVRSNLVAPWRRTQESERRRAVNEAMIKEVGKDLQALLDRLSGDCSEAASRLPKELGAVLRGKAKIVSISVGCVDALGTGGIHPFLEGRTFEVDGGIVEEMLRVDETLTITLRESTKGIGDRLFLVRRVTGVYSPELRVVVER